MENFELTISLIGTTVSFLATCLIFILKFIIAVRKKRKIENDTAILDAVVPLMEIAEKYINYSGEEKKEFVITKLNQFAIENKLNFDEETISQKIEELIKLTKQVN